MYETVNNYPYDYHIFNNFYFPQFPAKCGAFATY